MKRDTHAFLGALLILASASFAPARYIGEPAPSPLTAAERAAAAMPTAEVVHAATTALTAADMEGRGTGAAGGERAAEWLAQRFKAYGLEPAGDNGSYFQSVALTEWSIGPETAITIGSTSLQGGKDCFPLAPSEAKVTGELVQIGYGVVASELNHDDLTGIDLKGKIVVAFTGRPEKVPADTWNKAGNTQRSMMALFGGAAAALIVVSDGTEDLGRIIEHVGGRRLELAGGSERAGVPMPQVLLVTDQGAEKLFAAAGQKLADVRTRVRNGERVSGALGHSADVTVTRRAEARVARNVVACLRGADEQLRDQAVVFSAHYDAFGVDSDGKVHVGAADNALGTAELVAIAEAASKLPVRPRRTMVFLAVTGEEYGLLGSRYWVGHPTWPLEKVVANINFDGIGTEVYGEVKRVVGFGAEHSSLGKTLAAVVEGLGCTMAADPMPEMNIFQRSDHFSFVKKGVPAIMLLGGPGGDVNEWVDRARVWMDTDYHQPTDVIHDDWHWEGARSIAAIGFLVGLRVANATEAPTWNADSIYKPK
jgi:Zn-dependent M28 family amino/carboxypeptidase